MTGLSPLTVFLGIGLVAALIVILYMYGKDDPADINSLKAEIASAPELGPIDRITLLIEAGRLQSATMAWHERALSAMGVVTFLGALGALIVQAVQNTALEQKSALETNKLELFRAQADRAQKLMEPVVGSIIRNFEQNGARPSADEKELLSFAIDQWLAAPPVDEKYSIEDLKRAFRAALIVSDYAAALAAANRLGRDFPSQTNPAEQVSLFEYAYITGWGQSERRRIGELLTLPGSRMPPDVELRLIAVARGVGLLKEAQAIARAARASGLSAEAAAGRLEELGLRLRKSRDGVLAASRQSVER